MHSLSNLEKQPLVVLFLGLHRMVHQQASLLDIFGQGQLMDVDQLAVVFADRLLPAGDLGEMELGEYAVDGSSAVGMVGM